MAKSINVTNAGRGRGRLYTPFDDRSRLREWSNLLPTLMGRHSFYEPSYRLRKRQPINASFPVYGAFWRVYAVNVDPALYLSSASLYQVAGNISRRIRVLCPFVDPRKFWKSDPRETRQPYRSMWKCWRKNYEMCNLTNRIFFICTYEIPNFFYGTIQRGNTSE